MYTLISFQNNFLLFLFLLSMYQIIAFLIGPFSRLFDTVDRKQYSIYILPMTGFEQGTSVGGHNHSTNLAIITATAFCF